MKEKVLKPINSATPGRLESEWSENLDSFSTLNFNVHRNQSTSTVLWDLFDIPVLLIFIGCSSAIVSYTANMILAFGDTFRMSFVGHLYDYHKMFLYCLMCIFATMLATFITQSICPQATGGGLPEMKTILGGVVKPVLLSKKLIIAKFLGVILSLVGGLSVGKEGPFVHISAAIADQLMRLSIFNHVRRQDGKRLEVIACACASGVSSTFGAAFGGVLFSIEFTASAYRVKNLPKACLTSVIALVALLFLGGTRQLARFPTGGEHETLSDEGYTPNAREVLGFALIGVLCGLLGALFVTLVQGLTNIRNTLLDLKKNSKRTVDTRRYLLVASVTLIVAVLMYVENALTPSDESLSVIDRIIQQKPFRSVSLSLGMFFAYKVLVTALSVTLPLPVGLFTPVFLTGGVLGRIVGELLVDIPGATSFAPWEYSLIGAAAFSTGVVRAISTVVIVYEVSGQPHLLLPMSVAVLCAYFTGNRLTKNIYEVLMHASNTPYLKDLPRELYSVPVSHVMVPMDENHVLTLNSTYGDAITLLEVLAETTRCYLPQTSAPPTLSHSAQGNIGADLAAERPDWEGQLEEEDEMERDEFRIHSKVEAERCAYVYHHIPAVIPVVQSKRSMVIVGAVLRADLKRTVNEVVAMVNLARSTPVSLGLVETPTRATQRAPSRSLFGHLHSTTGAPSTMHGEVELSDQSRAPLLTPVNISHHPPAISSAALTMSHPDQLSAVGSYGSLSASDAGHIMDDIIHYVIVSDNGRSTKPIRSATDVRRNQISRNWRALSLTIPLDTSPYQVVDSMHLSKVDLLFRMLSLNQAYVTNSGRLVGLVTRASLREFIGSRTKRPFDRLRLLWTTITKQQQQQTERRRGGYQALEQIPPTAATRHSSNNASIV